ncbi:hypothetical protein AC578_5350 [Pseudocercospora eumusae]|uniref:tRNA ligase n=1 Tax=Pseudocercospora eumusae TaxID=321146 RepID=A0A139H2P9_9PEZI|nr:hypothetical protein AC578_5350 [Pseudocercospora eumusae]
MASLYEGAPYKAQDTHQVAEMLRALEDNKGRGKTKAGFSCKKSTFAVDGTHITVDSWKMQDWDYKKPNLPTYARGLFTTTTRKGTPEIAVRGYDKFFNHGETRETEWPNVEANTRGPYELSVKENGCIIFLAGLEDGTLIVCSKHSTGARADVETSHAAAGERWVERHLARAGKTKQDLAMRLRHMNATAVAELCDDEFEEHVLEYTPEAAGLYLHGINLNLPEFATYPHHLVDRFADEWGFKKTTYLIKHDIHDVHHFLEQVAETGNFQGRDTEGFVIRCQSKANTNAWHDWFFKYKFEEPYLMYRQWRECTKAVIAGRPPKYKKHKKITEDYLLFARRQLHANKELAKAYNNNHGIIKMREDFLKSRGVTGADIIRAEAAEGEISSDEVTKDVVLVPVATIGCGKTTIALGLVKLFGWGHIQNDNITVKRGKPQAFATACCNALAEENAMIADRNNHQRRERQQLIDDVSKVVPNARFVALHFVHDRSNYDQIRTALRDRVLSRGDNHQTIHTSKGSEEIIGIMEGFLHRFEPVNHEAPPDDGFDIVIDLDPTVSSRQNLETVVTRLYTEYPKLFGGQDMPTPDDMDLAIDAALNDYQVDIKHEIKGFDKKNNKLNGSRQQANGNQPKPKEKKVEYFAVQVPAARVNAVLDAMFADASAEASRMFKQLKNTRRIQAEFHVTLIHRATAADHQDTWAYLTDLYAKASAPTEERAFPIPDPKLGVCSVRLERLIWDSRCMAFIVRLQPAEGSTEQFQTTNKTAHITVGTASPDIKPKESNDMLARWLQEGSGANGINEMAVKGNVELEGTVKGILSR